jgi:hypothetical protein
MAFWQSLHSLVGSFKSTDTTADATTITITGGFIKDFISYMSFFCTGVRRAEIIDPVSPTEAVSIYSNKTDFWIGS